MYCSQDNMDTSSSSTAATGSRPTQSFEDAVLKAEIAHICDYVGYNAMTLDSSNILVDIYRRLVYHLARHCHEAATNNRRTEATLLDLMQAFQFVGIPIDDLIDHIKNVKFNHEIKFEQEAREPSNKIQRNLLVDDLLDAEKTSKIDDPDEENKAILDNEIQGDDKVVEPPLIDTYKEISSKFTDCKPVTADKNIKLGSRIVFKNAPAPLDSDKPLSEIEQPSTVALVEKKIRTKIKAPEEPVSAKTLAKTPDKKLKDTKKGKLGKKMKNFRASKFEETSPNTLDSLSVSDPKSIEKPSKGRGLGKKTLKQPIVSAPPDSPIVDHPSDPIVLETPTEVAVKSKGTSRKKPKSTSHVTPLDPSIAEPPSFLQILVPKKEAPSPDKNIQEEGLSMLAPPTIKQAKPKKRKKSANQFAIVTETVTATDEKEWLCPACGGPDDGDLMVQCDKCEEWYHLGCTCLKKPPDDDEHWECEICIKRIKLETSQMRTPDLPVVKIEPIPTPVSADTPIIQVPHGSSQDDLCPECNLADDGTLMIQCDDPDCARWFHGKCVNLLEEPKETESWFCKACVDKQQSAFQRRRRAK